MAENKEAVRQRLLAEAQAAMEGMLSEEVIERLQRGQISLAAIKSQALAMGRAAGEPLMQQMLEVVSEGQQPAPVCPHCGGQLRNKGRKTRPVVIQRLYFYCCGCQQRHGAPTR